MKEIDFQTKIIKRIKEEGGWGRKISQQFQVGMPDTILIHKKCGSAFVEVKLMDNEDGKNFNRAIDTTPKQKETMDKINDAGGCAFVMVVVKRGIGKYDIACVLPDQEKLQFDKDSPGYYDCSMWGRQTLKDDISIVDLVYATKNNNYDIGPGWVTP